jgi:hypothetical protein
VKTIQTKSGKLILIENIDYNKLENQIGCGYCKEEKVCKMRDPKINLAKLGCKYFKHYTELHKCPKRMNDSNETRN